MKIRFILILFSALLVNCQAWSQEINMAEGRGADSLQGHFLGRLERGAFTDDLTVTQDGQITNILRKIYDFNKNQQVPGYRLLIYRGQDRNRAFEVQADFVVSFGDLGIPVVVKYQEPDFYTLIGAFRTREDVFRLRKLVQLRYPSAYTVPDKLRITEFE